MPEVENRTVPVGACKPHPGNYNRHDEGQIADLRLSLQKFGQVRSIVVQDDGAGGYLLVAGHGLHAAAAAEGLTELRADVIPADWPPVKVIAYLAADNELARRGSPDEAQLAALVRQIEEEADAELARLAAGGEERLKELLAGMDGESRAAAKAQARKTLAERFIVPPFSVLDARQGYWQERKRAWLALGIQSELGRGDNVLGHSDQSINIDFYTQKRKLEAEMGRDLTTDEARTILLDRGAIRLADRSRERERERELTPKMAMHNDPMQRKRKYDGGDTADALGRT